MAPIAEMGWGEFEYEVPKGWFGKEKKKIKYVGYKPVFPETTGSEILAKAIIDNLDLGIHEKLVLEKALTHTHESEITDPPIPVVKNPKLREGMEYHRILGGMYEAGKWSTFLHLLVTPMILKYNTDSILRARKRENFIKALKEALSRVKITDVKAHLHGYTPHRIDDLKDGFILPPLEEVLQDPKKRKDLVSWLRIALKGLDIDTYAGEIDELIDKIYPIAIKIHEKFAKKWIGSDSSGNPITRAKIEDVKQWEEFKQYLRVLQEFADVKLKQPEPTIAQKRAQPVERIHTEERTIGTPTDLTNAKLEVLSMLQALKLLNYSEEAVNNAMMDFKKKITDIVKLENPTLEDICRLGLYYLALSYIREGKFEKAEEVLRHLRVFLPSS